MYKHSHRPAILSEDLPRISATDYVRNFARHIERTEGRRIRGHYIGEAMHLQELLHIPANTASKSVQDIQTGEYFWGVQKVAFVSSNLGRGKGFVWYFICNGCGRQVKFLYEPSLLRSPVCRVCCRIGYRQPNRGTRTLSRLLRQAHLSQEAKLIIIKQAGLTKADFPAEVLP